ERLLRGSRRRKDGRWRVHQEGVPQAGHAVPPGPQPGRQGGRRPVQGGHRGVRGASRHRQARALRPLWPRGSQARRQRAGRRRRVRRLRVRGRAEHLHARLRRRRLRRPLRAAARARRRAEGQGPADQGAHHPAGGGHGRPQDHPGAHAGPLRQLQGHRLRRRGRGADLHHLPGRRPGENGAAQRVRAVRQRRRMPHLPRRGQDDQEPVPVVQRRRPPARRKHGGRRHSGRGEQRQLPDAARRGQRRPPRRPARRRAGGDRGGGRSTLPARGKRPAVRASRFVQPGGAGRRRDHPHRLRRRKGEGGRRFAERRSDHAPRQGAAAPGRRRARRPVRAPERVDAHRAERRAGGAVPPPGRAGGPGARRAPHQGLVGPREGRLRRV
ncbi:MAG: Chaperone protein DnaJ, partial [uncultured Gemmatimonadetes bacterium]